MPIAANSPADRVEQLTILTERLTGLLQQEIDLLKERRPSDITAHAQERDKLAAVYAQEMSLIRKDRKLIDGAGPKLLNRLKTVTAGFREVIAAHEGLLTAMQSVSEGIVRSVAEQAQAKTRTITGYGKDAGLRSSNGSRPAALALNQMV